MKKNITVSVDADRLSALTMYLEQKNLVLGDELEKCVEELYRKIVPQNVRDFIEMKSACPATKGRGKVKAVKTENGEVK